MPVRAAFQEQAVPQLLGRRLAEALLVQQRSQPLEIVAPCIWEALIGINTVGELDHRPDTVFRIIEFGQEIVVLGDQRLCDAG